MSNGFGGFGRKERERFFPTPLPSALPPPPPAPLPLDEATRSSIERAFISRPPSRAKPDEPRPGADAYAGQVLLELLAQEPDLLKRKFKAETFTRFFHGYGTHNPDVSFYKVLKEGYGIDVFDIPAGLLDDLTEENYDEKREFIIGFTRDNTSRILETEHGVSAGVRDEPGLNALYHLHSAVNEASRQEGLTDEMLIDPRGLQSLTDYTQAETERRIAESKRPSIVSSIIKGQQKLMRDLPKKFLPGAALTIAGAATGIAPLAQTGMTQMASQFPGMYEQFVETAVPGAEYEPHWSHWLPTAMAAVGPQVVTALTPEAPLAGMPGGPEGPPSPVGAGAGAVGAGVAGAGAGELADLGAGAPPWLQTAGGLAGLGAGLYGAYQATQIPEAPQIPGAPPIPALPPVPELSPEQTAARQRMLELRTQLLGQIGQPVPEAEEYSRRMREQMMTAAEPQFAAAMFRRGLAGSTGYGTGLSELAADIEQKAYFGGEQLRAQREQERMAQLRYLEAPLAGYREYGLAAQQAAAQQPMWTQQQALAGQQIGAQQQMWNWQQERARQQATQQALTGLAGIGGTLYGGGLS